MTPAHDPRPIGVFDSGIGGLTAVREIFRVLPGERVIYFGDTARLPYGSKSAETVTRFSLEIARFLTRQDVKCIVVACNTSSSVALEALEAALEVPVIGVIEPGAEAALAASPNARIGVIGTYGTIGSAAYTHAIERRRPGATVISHACPLFVPFVEEGWLDHPATRLVAEEYLRDARDGRLDSLILGCTHYPLLAPLIGSLMGPGVTLVDPGAEAARATARLLAARGELAEHPAPEHRFYLSDQPRQFGRIASAFLGRELPEVRLIDPSELPVAHA